MMIYKSQMRHTFYVMRLCSGGRVTVLFMRVIVIQGLSS